jgi:hypothetical protein
MEDLRDEIYWWSLNLIEKGFKLEGIFLLLSTWNFAYFRYHLLDFKLEGFKKLLDSCDFEFFKDMRFESVNLSDNEITDKIKSIYSSLSQFEGIKYVGATKIMHLLRPNFFVMWDTKIIQNYQKKTAKGYINTSPSGYVNFMKEMQKRYRNNEFLNLTKRTSIPRAIDLYNLSMYSISHES